MKDIGSMSDREFKRHEMEHELRNEPQSRKKSSWYGARPAPAHKLAGAMAKGGPKPASSFGQQPKASGLIYHPNGSKTDKNGKKYDFHNGDAESGHSKAKALGGKFAEFKPKTLKEFVIEATTEISGAKVKLSGKADKVVVDPEFTDLKSDENQNKIS
jgi:hypothetical protein